MNLNKAFCFYYGFMNANERAIYDTMLAGFKDYRIGFEIPTDDVAITDVVFEKVLLDHPEVFYIKGYTLMIPADGGNLEFKPDYRFSKEDSILVYEKSEEKIAAFLEKVRGLSDEEKELRIHNYIVNLVEYDDKDAPYCHEMPGVFLYGLGVCEGISKAFKYLCDRLGIRCGIAVGNVNWGEDMHAWNVICLNNKWYLVDVTCDYSYTKKARELRYDYYNLTEQELTDRNITYPIPRCNTHYGYYERCGRSANSKAELKKLLRRNRGPLISFMMSGSGYNEEQKRALIMKAMEENSWLMGARSACLIPNFDMNVYTFQVTYYA